SKPVDRFNIVNRTLTSAIVQARRCQPPSTHRLILVWAEEQHVAEKFYQRFQAALDTFRQEYTKWRTFHKLDTPTDTPSPTNVHLFNVRAELFIYRHNDPRIPDIKARLTATRFNDQLDYHPPEIPMGPGPLTVVFLRALPYRQFEFPNVASIILTSMPQDLYSYLFWAGRTGRGTPCGEIITLVSPSDYFLAWFIRTHNAPTKLTSPEQLAHVPIERPLATPPALLKPFDPTNRTGVKKPFENTPTPDVFDWDL
ncbi:mRNA splicing protein prp28, partial [Dispira simplex]